MTRRRQSERARQPGVLATNRIPLFILTILALCLLGGYLYLSRLYVPPENPESRAGVGQSIEYLNLQPLTGDARAVTRADLEGRVVLLNIWGTWCPPCRTELPHLAALRGRFAGQEDFQLLAVSYPASQDREDVDSLRTETSQLLNSLNLDLPTYYDPNYSLLYNLEETLDFRGFPTTLLLDRRGVIRAVWVGYRPGVETEMEWHIGRLLSETPSADSDSSAPE